MLSAPKLHITVKFNSLGKKIEVCFPVIRTDERKKKLKELIKHLTSHGVLSNKEYGFRYSKSTADILTIITERVYQALDRNGVALVVALDISKAF